MRPISPWCKSRMHLEAGLTLYFARHGQTEANLQKRFSGNKDTPLTPLGLEQAAQVGHILKRELGDASGYQFISSPLARAVMTMRIARQVMGLPAEGFATDNRLKEIDLGVWDQLTDQEARALSPVMFEQRGNDGGHPASRADVVRPQDAASERDAERVRRVRRVAPVVDLSAAEHPEEALVRCGQVDGAAEVEQPV